MRKTYQLPRKNLLVEVELDLFVGDVYTKLFKRIPFEILKAKYVQNPNSVIIVAVKRNKDNCLIKRMAEIVHERKETNQATKFEILASFCMHYQQCCGDN